MSSRKINRQLVGEPGVTKCNGISVDSLITAVARALARGDPLGALKRIASQARGCIVATAPWLGPRPESRETPMTSATEGGGTSVRRRILVPAP